MTPHFLFSSHPLKPATVEQMFADQFDALRVAGFSRSLLPESVIQHNKPLSNIPPGASVVYRGWMLNAVEYQRLTDAIVSVSAKPFTSLSAYLAAHHLPNWYPLVKDFTPETRVLSKTADYKAELRRLGWDSFFIKDYVKSLKTTLGSIIRDPSQIDAVVTEMEQFRGEIEGGLCVRRVERFIADTERRYFVLNGKVFSASSESIPEIVEEVAHRISSPFFSVDVIRREDGVLRVVEIGDGQVSDIVGWSAEAFAAMWTTIETENK